MSTPRNPSIHRRFLIPVLALSLALAPLGAGLTAGPADAAARVSVVSSLGASKANATGSTSIKVTGSGLQSIKNAFGGIYVVFGYAKDASSWRPSKGGKSGRDFFYVADSQSKANQGFQRFVAFPGSSTAETANGGALNANGSFSLSMVIPGPTFSAETASGGTKSIDCREVQCGVFTFGAHGVANGNNETFTPLSFGDASPAAISGANGSSATETSRGATTGQGGSTSTRGSEQQQTLTEQNSENSTQQGGTGQMTTTPDTTTDVPDESGTTPIPQAVTNGNPSLGVEQQTVVAGRTLGFAAQGFSPGEQVVATLASGVTAAGPIAAGTFGEVAGAAQIPTDLAPGTHKIKLTGAGSGTSVETEFSVMANPATLATPDTSQKDGVWWALVAVIVAGSLLVLLVLSSLITALVRNKKNSRKQRRAKNRSRTKLHGGATVIAAPELQDDDSWFTATAESDPQGAPYAELPPDQEPWEIEPEPVTEGIAGTSSHAHKERV